MKIWFLVLYLLAPTGDLLPVYEAEFHSLTACAVAREYVVPQVAETYDGVLVGACVSAHEEEV